MKKEQPKPISINNDIWFYRNKKSFTFIVWTKLENGRRECVQFNLPHSKIKKYL